MRGISIPAPPSLYLDGANMREGREGAVGQRSGSTAAMASMASFQSASMSARSGQTGPPHAVEGHGLVLLVVDGLFEI
jgi:2-methylcitrate dehydratase PrpD